MLRCGAIHLHIAASCRAVSVPVRSFSMLPYDIASYSSTMLSYVLLCEKCHFDNLSFDSIPGCSRRGKAATVVATVELQLLRGASSPDLGDVGIISRLN